MFDWIVEISEVNMVESNMLDCDELDVLADTFRNNFELSCNVKYLTSVSETETICVSGEGFDKLKEFIDSLKCHEIFVHPDETRLVGYATIQTRPFHISVNRELGKPLDSKLIEILKIIYK